MENLISVFAKMVDEGALEIKEVPLLIKSKVVSKVKEVKQEKGGKNK